LRRWLTQINAVWGALRRMESRYWEDHVSLCAAEAFAEGDTVEKRHNFHELVETTGRMTR
jgi:DNA-binding FrmR family transcriptional regulator